MKVFNKKDDSNNHIVLIQKVYRGYRLRRILKKYNAQYRHFLENRGSTKIKTIIIPIAPIRNPKRTSMLFSEKRISS